MRIVIDIPKDVYTRLFDNGIQDNEIATDDICKIARSIRLGMSLPKGHGDLIDKEKLKENINGWYAFMKDICKQPYMTLKQEEIIGKIDMMTSIIEADKTESDEGGEQR